MEPQKPERMNAMGDKRIDLEWAKQKIHGFDEMMRKAQAVKESEEKYRTAKKNGKSHDNSSM